MHDPMCVAFEIRRPWPAHYSTHLGRQRRWWPPIISVWHVEPRGHDSGEVCRQYDRATGRVLHGWRWHIHHWRIQVHALQELRRRVLTRCAWCGGGHYRRDPVDVSRSWDGPRGRWWQGEPSLHHVDCSAIAGAHDTCVCENPIHEHELAGWTYGRCARCAKHRGWRTTADQLDRLRILAAVPAGRRDPAAYERICAMVKAEREASDL